LRGAVLRGRFTRRRNSVRNQDRCCVSADASSVSVLPAVADHSSAVSSALSVGQSLAIEGLSTTGVSPAPSSLA
jgi:hypothetical protein